MLKKFFMLYFFFIFPLFSSDQKSILVDPDLHSTNFSEIFNTYTSVRIVYSSHQETAEEILTRNKNKPELMSCRDWLKQERTNFSEEALASHPLFSAVRESMARADFEVDVLIGFTNSVCAPSVQNLISKSTQDERQNIEDTIVSLRTNAVRAKYFTANVIDMLEGKVKIEDN